MSTNDALPKHPYATNLLRAALYVAANAVARVGVSVARSLELSRQVVRLTRSLIAKESANHRFALKRAMQGSAIWRSRVLADLGGERALLRWENRLKHARDRLDRPRTIRETMAQSRARHAAKVAARHRAALPDRYGYEARRWASPDHSRIVYDAVRVDQEGQFRLAPIPRGARLAQSGPSSDRRAVRCLWRDPKRFAPVALIPSDLRRRIRKARDHGRARGLWESAREHSSQQNLRPAAKARGQPY